MPLSRLTAPALCLALLSGCSCPEPKPEPEVPSKPSEAATKADAPPAWIGVALAKQAKREWPRLQPSERRAWLKALITGQSLAPPEADDENVWFQSQAASTSKADRGLARLRIVRQAFQRVLSDLSFSILSPKLRRELEAELVNLLRDESFEANASGGLLSARLSLVQTRERILDLIRAGQTVGREEFVLAVNPKGWFVGEGLRPEEQRLLPQVIAASSSDYLLQLRFRKATRASDKTRVERAAVDLGADPTTASLRSFADMFRAGWVLTVKGAIRFEAFPPSSEEAKEHHGYLRCEGLRVRLYSRKRDSILAEFVIPSQKGLRLPRREGARAVHQPWIRRGKSFSEQVEGYARHLGTSVGVHVARTQLRKHYRK